MAQPGLTAGTCLRKDFTFSEERSSAPGMLLAVSRVHESVPLFLVEGLKRRLGGSPPPFKTPPPRAPFKRGPARPRAPPPFTPLPLLRRGLATVAPPDTHAPRG